MYEVAAFIGYQNIGVDIDYLTYMEKIGLRKVNIIPPEAKRRITEEAIKKAELIVAMDKRRKHA